MMERKQQVKEDYASGWLATKATTTIKYIGKGYVADSLITLTKDSIIAVQKTLAEDDIAIG